MIRFERVTKTHGGGSRALDEISFEVAAGELMVLLGPSGCGKTTTLKSINRLVEPTSGTVYLDGKDVRAGDAIALRRSVGYVFQGFGLFPHMTVAENVGIVPGLLGWPEEETRARVDELLELVGLPPREYGARFPKELSGGQQQRVGLARALAARPRVLLMDEPFGALDPVTRDALQIELRRIHETLGLTTVMVTHDRPAALLLADRILVMAKGRIEQLGTPAELLDAPASDVVRALMETPRRQLDRLEQLSGRPRAAEPG